MIKVVLFDMDGTLLGMDENLFLKLYMSSLYEYCFEKDKYQVKQAAEMILSSVKEMAFDDNQNMTCMEKFYHYFSKKLLPSSDINSYIPKFDAYYLTPYYLTCKKATFEKEYMKKAIQYLLDKGYRICITTNPIFPKVGILKRLEWAGLNKDDFEFVTYGENSHFIKPNLNYYKEILSRLNVKENEVLMVGNDVEEDMISGTLGFQTYLVMDHLLSRNNKENEIKSRGSSQDFYNYVRENL